MGFNGRQCRACGSASNLHRHHIVFRSHFGKLRQDEQEAESNYMDLCATDHERVHARTLYIVRYPNGRVRFIERSRWEKIYGKDRKPDGIDFGEITSEE